MYTRQSTLNTVTLKSRSDKTTYNVMTACTEVSSTAGGKDKAWRGKRLKQMLLKTQCEKSVRFASVT
jgi:hypothetical protein